MNMKRVRHVLGMLTGGKFLSLSRRPIVEREQREECLAYVGAVTSITAFWDRESGLFNNTLVKYLDSIAESSSAASETCKAANRLVQAAYEALRRHEITPSLPDFALGVRSYYCTFFINLKEWAEGNLAAVEALAEGLTPHYEHVQRLMEKRESAWHQAQRAEGELLRQLGMTGPEFETYLSHVHSSLESAENDNWRPDMSDYEFSGNVEEMRT